MLILSHYLQGFREMDNFPSETGEKAMLKNVRHSHAKVRFLHFSLRWCKRAQKKHWFCHIIYKVFVKSEKMAPEGGQQPNVNNGKNVQPLFNKDENAKRDVHKVLYLSNQNGPP